jgi:hypothetical protein
MGPIGWALTAVTVALEIFMGSSAATEGQISALKDTVDATTGAFTELSYQAAATQFRSDLSKEDIDKMASYGITIEAMAKAALDGGAAAEAMNAKFKAAQAAAGFDSRDADMLDIAQRNFQGYAGVVEETNAQLSIDREAAADAARIALEETAAAEKAAAQSAATLAEGVSLGYAFMTTEQQKQTKTLQTLNAMSEASNDALKENFNRVADAALAYSEALSRINAILNVDAAKSKVITGFQELKKAIDESKGSLDSHTESGDKARAAVRNQIQAFQTFAESIDDPAKKTQYLKDQMDKLNTVLDKGKVNKKERGELLDPVVKAIEDAQAAVTDARDAAASARLAGVELGDGLTAGLIAAITEGTDPLIAAVDSMGEAVKMKLKEMWEIKSPSKFTMYIGEMLMSGLSMGIANGEGGFLESMKRTMQDAKWALADAKDRVFDARTSVAEAEGSREQARARRELAKALRDQADAVDALKTAENDLKNIQAGKIPKDLFDEAFSAASARIDKFKQKGLDFLDYSKSIADGLASFGAITSLSSDGMTAPTAEGIVSNLKTKLAQVRAFGRSLKQLQALNLNKASMAEIISAGPEAGGQIAAALLAEGRKAIGDVNSLQASFAGASTKVGNIGAESQFGMTAAQAEGRAGTSFTFTDGAVQVNVGTGVTMKEQALLKAAVKEAVTKAINDASRQAAMA